MNMLCEARTTEGLLASHAGALQIALAQGSATSAKAENMAAAHQAPIGRLPSVCIAAQEVLQAGAVEGLHAMHADVRIHDMACRAAAICAGA